MGVLEPPIDVRDNFHHPKGLMFVLISTVTKNSSELTPQLPVTLLHLR